MIVGVRSVVTSVAGGLQRGPSRCQTEPWPPRLEMHQCVGERWRRRVESAENVRVEDGLLMKRPRALAGVVWHDGRTPSSETAEMPEWATATAVGGTPSC